MKKRIGLTFAIGLMVSLASMQASMIPCADTKLSALIALGSGPGNGCTVDDKVFNNFSYLPRGSAPVASLVTAQLEADPGTLTFGWLFGSLTGSFRGNFVLGFTVAVDPAACPTCTITSTESQQFPGTAPPGTQAFSIAESSGPTPVLLDNLSFGGNTNGSLISPGVVTLTELATSSGITRSDPLLSLKMDVRQTLASTVPEPAMLPLMGMGLLGLGFLRRSRAQK